MRSPRYTILIANRKTGAVRRLTVSRRVVGTAAAVVFAVPMFLLLGTRGASQAELAALRSANEGLLIENESYREATGELTDQISSLQTALTQLNEQAALDPATKAAIERLPALIRARAAGGGASALRAAAAPAAAPENTIGILRDLLRTLESGLASVKTKVDSRTALAQASPTSWPVMGWLSSSFGPRKDPFTGQPDFHTGLDISAGLGTPVKATADGTVESAAYNGNYGNSIVITHGFGIATRFGHLSQYAVRAGQTVKRGEIIGYVGSTGRATSPHLHYEILLNGQPSNPLRLLTKPY